ncbi:uncharacterized protein QC763_0044910 [Podospora pseudopauciseta]|uniref:Uncharacterized protein n=1 Tax=Podospora pseudopauciseta TaxID=2093780 RepID=A0ABR0HRB9_9PEZI|nr:hypothetical protein QC763_0044910 [Podospora pseudopauciseta]
MPYPSAPPCPTSNAPLCSSCCTTSRRTNNLLDEASSYTTVLSRLHLLEPQLHGSSTQPSRRLLSCRTVQPAIEALRTRHAAAARIFCRDRR